MNDSFIHLRHLEEGLEKDFVILPGLQVLVFELETYSLLQLSDPNPHEDESHELMYIYWIVM